MSTQLIMSRDLLEYLLDLPDGVTIQLVEEDLHGADHPILRITLSGEYANAEGDTEVLPDGDVVAVYEDNGMGGVMLVGFETIEEAQAAAEQQG